MTNPMKERVQAWVDTRWREDGTLADFVAEFARIEVERMRERCVKACDADAERMRAQSDVIEARDHRLAAEVRFGAYAAEDLANTIRAMDAEESEG